MKRIAIVVFALLLAVASAAWAGLFADFTRQEIADVLKEPIASLDLNKVNTRVVSLLKKLAMEFKTELALCNLTPEAIDERFAAVGGDVLSEDAAESDDWIYQALDELAAAGIIPTPSEKHVKRSYNVLHYAVDNDNRMSDAMRQALSSLARMSPRPRVGITRSAAPTARYEEYDDNPVKLVARDPLSTFSLDVNTTSYANVRRFLNSGSLPNPDAVRVEELINYFPASAGDMKPSPVSGSPFYVAYELAPCPWNGNNVLMWVSLTARDIDYKNAPPANLVFLVDVSGSMDEPERLPLVQSALRSLVKKLRPDDMISIVTYAGSTSIALAATKGVEKAKILSAIDNLAADGSTAGAAGLALAYEQARNNFIDGGVNRILLCTDGDFNVGVSGTSELEAMVKRERESGVTLSVLGFGDDNYNDEMMTHISNVGNGNYGYVDSMSEALKILDEEMTATLVTVAKDVKAQIEFNPENVIEYRQIGYEKRQLEAEDFNNDAVDAGDIGAGKRVTILYELTLSGAKPNVDPLRYQQSQVLSGDEHETTDMKPEELAYLKFRWKESDGIKSSMAATPILKSAISKTFEDAGMGLRFTAAVAAYGQKLRGSANLAGTQWSAIASWAEGSRGNDEYRAEFVRLVRIASNLSPSSD
jgi:Ca-activated chloride channel family protein